MIINNKEFDREQKTLRLTAVFLDLVLEYLGTLNMDIGILTDDYIYKTNKEIINHISISFQFYKDLVQE